MTRKECVAVYKDLVALVGTNHAKELVEKHFAEEIKNKDWDKLGSEMKDLIYWEVLPNAEYEEDTYHPQA